jgi:hypothetical protein
MKLRLEFWFLLAVVVVRGIEARQRSKLQRSKAWAQSFGPA